MRRKILSISRRFASPEPRSSGRHPLSVLWEATTKRNDRGDQAHIPEGVVHMRFRLLQLLPSSAVRKRLRQADGSMLRLKAGGSVGLTRSTTNAVPFP